MEQSLHDLLWVNQFHHPQLLPIYIFLRQPNFNRKTGHWVAHQLFLRLWCWVDKNSIHNRIEPLCQNPHKSFDGHIGAKLQLPLINKGHVISFKRGDAVENYAPPPQARLSLAVQIICAIMPLCPPNTTHSLIYHPHLYLG